MESPKLPPDEPDPVESLILKARATIRFAAHRPEGSRRDFEVFYRVIDRKGAVRMEYRTKEELPKAMRDYAARQIHLIYNSGQHFVIAYSARAPEGEMGVVPEKNLEFISEKEFRRIEADGWQQFADLD